jgi:RNA polymerase sigma factor (sigma-70 family)
VIPDPGTRHSETGRGAAVEQLLAARGPHLMRAAIALAGSRPDGEDLLQAALERLLRNYRRVESDAERYLRRTLYNLAADGWRRRGVVRRWQPVVTAPEGRVDGTDAVDIRDALVRLLAQLPPRQRVVVVLRYWEQLSEAETAAPRRRRFVTGAGVFAAVATLTAAAVTIGMVGGAPTPGKPASGKSRRGPRDPGRPSTCIRCHPGHPARSRTPRWSAASSRPY